MSAITSTFIRIAAAAVLALECIEAAGYGHGTLPMGGSHASQIGVLLGGSVVLAELVELVVNPAVSRIAQWMRAAWKAARRLFGRRDES